RVSGQAHRYQGGLQTPHRTIRQNKGDGKPKGQVMVEPYQAVGLVPTMRGIRPRDEIAVNIEHISYLIKAASWLSSLDLPVRLIAIPEGALQGFNDEVLDLDHETFARECAIDVPG